MATRGSGVLNTAAGSGVENTAADDGADRVLDRLTAALPQTGRLDWIGLRPDRRAPMQPVDTASVTAAGLDGDRGRGGKRAITLIQAEHLPAIAALVGWAAPLHPGLLRRNLVVSGINLLALKGRRFAIGSVLLEGTQPCHPCSRMEAALGPGGWNAMRGHGGLCARVLTNGPIAVGDDVRCVPDAEAAASGQGGR